MSLPKQTRTTLHPKHKMKLDTVRGVVAEQGRLYRLWTNGKIKANEMTKGMFGLREIRCSLEVLQEEPVTERHTVVHITSIPHGEFLDNTKDRGGQLTLEHRADEGGKETLMSLTSPSETNDFAQDEITEPEPIVEPKPISRNPRYTPLPPRARDGM
jgi:hypothetical protein